MNSTILLFCFIYLLLCFSFLSCVFCLQLCFCFVLCFPVCDCVLYLVVVFYSCSCAFILWLWLALQSHRTFRALHCRSVSAVVSQSVDFFHKERVLVETFPFIAWTQGSHCAVGWGLRVCAARAWRGWAWGLVSINLTQHPSLWLPNPPFPFTLTERLRHGGLWALPGSPDRAFYLELLLALHWPTAPWTNLNGCWRTWGDHAPPDLMVCAQKNVQSFGSLGYVRLQTATHDVGSHSVHCKILTLCKRTRIFWNVAKKINK